MTNNNNSNSSRRNCYSKCPAIWGTFDSQSSTICTYSSVISLVLEPETKLLPGRQPPYLYFRYNGELRFWRYWTGRPWKQKYSPWHLSSTFATTWDIITSGFVFAISFTSGKRIHRRHRNLTPLNMLSLKTWKSLWNPSATSRNSRYDCFRFGGCYIYFRYKRMSDGADINITEDLHLKKRGCGLWNFDYTWDMSRSVQVNNKTISGIQDAILDFW